jgi:hypothetical protein
MEDCNLAALNKMKFTREHNDSRQYHNMVSVFNAFIYVIHFYDALYGCKIALPLFKETIRYEGL